MTTPRRLLSNTMAAVFGSAFQKLLTFATTLLLARGLGSDMFGVYAFVVAYISLFGVLVDLGFERVIAREVARHPARRGELLGTGLMIRGMLALVAAVVAITVAWLLGLPAITRWCIVLAALGLPLSVESFVRAFYQARFEVHYAYLLSLPGSVAFLLTAAAILWSGGSLVEVYAAALVIGVLSVALMLSVALPKMQVVWRLDGKLVRYLWRESWELGAVIVIWVITLRIDQLLLYWLRGPTDVGYYAAGVKITEALNLIPESIMVTVFPLLASVELTEPRRFQRIYELTIRYLIVLVLPIALVVTLERETLTSLLFGPEFVSGSGALVMLAWWMFFSYTGAVYVNLLIVRSQQRLIVRVSALALVINVALNLLLIPRWGATGAAAATLVSSAASFLVFCVAPESRDLMRTCYQAATRPLAALAASAVLVSWLAPAEWRAVIAPPVYLVVLWMIGGVGREDWELARKILKPEAS